MLAASLALLGGDRSKERAFAFDEVGKQRRIEVLEIGKEIGKNLFTSKGGLIRNHDFDAQGKLEVQEGGLFTAEDLAPCHICNI